MLKNLIKWLFESQKQADELDDKLNKIGISLCPLHESKKDFFDYSKGMSIILKDIVLPDNFSEERMFEDFFYGTDFDAFWNEYGEVFEP